MMRACLPLLTTAAFLWPQGSRELIFTARRTATVEVLDAATLKTTARIHFPFRVERIRPNGSTLFIDGYGDGKPCCRRYTLDPARPHLEEVFQNQVPDYFGACIPSADRSACARLKSYQGPALKIDGREFIPTGLEPRLPEGNRSVAGAWLGGTFYLYIHRHGAPGRLWSVPPGAADLADSIALDPFAELPGSLHRVPLDVGMVVAGGNIFLYEPIGNKLDRSAACDAPVPGGIWVLDPAAGQLAQHIAPDLHFNRLVAGGNASILYGVVPGDSAWRSPVRLIALDPHDGRVLQSRSFGGGVLQIATGTLPNRVAGDIIARN